MATRAKISELRANTNIASVEMTGYGEPTKSSAQATGSKPKAKKDFDGDKKIESSKKEHAGVVHNAIQKKKGGKQDGQDTRSEAFIADAKKEDGDKKVEELKKGKKNNVKVMPSFGEELKKDEKKEEEEDPRSMGTKYRNMKNRWRAMGLKLSHEPEGELTEETPAERIDRISATKVAQRKAKAEAETAARERRTVEFQKHKKETIAQGGRPVDALDSWQKKKLNKEEADPAADAKEKQSSDAIERKQKRADVIKKQVLLKKLQAVRAGGGSAITASHEPEGETIQEDEKTAAAVSKRTKELASKRRQKGYKDHGYNAYRPGKNERAGYKLADAQRSSGSSLETQRTKKKQPAGEDTSQIGHYKNRDAKRTTTKKGKPLKQPKYKLSLSQRVDHHSNKALNRRDPKQNPKHTANTANEEFVFNEEFITERVDFATEYFYKQGINPDGLDLIIEEVGLDTFYEFILEGPQELNEDEAAYQKAKKKAITGSDRREREGKGEYSPKGSSSPYAKQGIGAKTKKKPKIGHTGTKVVAATKKAKKAQPLKPTSREGIGSKVRSAFDAGMKRHKAAREKGRVPEQRAKEFASGVKSGVKTAVKFAKDAKKAVAGN